MKKVLAFLLVLSMVVLALAACGNATDTGKETKGEETKTEESKGEETKDAETTDSSVMTHAQYVAAELDTAVVVVTYVQAKQSWWDNKATVYAQSEDGAYFLYNMACSEADYAKLTPGTKIKVSGYKSVWSGEVEITDATFEILEGNYIAEPTDVTALLGKNELIDHQNEYVAFKALQVVASKVDGDDAEHAFLYKWDNSGTPGDDLYFKVTDGENVYQFTVESYLCGKDTDVYKAVEGLTVGDTIDMTGFLYWYNGVNPHITSVTDTPTE